MGERERYNNISQVIFDQQQQRFQIYYSGGVMVFEALMEAMRRCDSRPFGQAGKQTSFDPLLRSALLLA